MSPLRTSKLKEYWGRGGGWGGGGVENDKLFNMNQKAIF